MSEEKPAVRFVEGGVISGDTGNPAYDLAGEPDWKQECAKLEELLVQTMCQRDVARAEMDAVRKRVEKLMQHGSPHLIDIIVRKDGQEFRHEGDWLKEYADREIVGGIVTGHMYDPATKRDVELYRHEFGDVEAIKSPWAGYQLCRHCRGTLTTEESERGICEGCETKDVPR
jgi:hypothetical protein